MTEDEAAAEPSRVSDPVFFALVALVFVLVVAAAGFLILGFGHHSSRAGAQQGTAFVPPPTSSRSLTARGAVAVVEKSFRLGAAGQFAQSCALESPAYLAFDAAHYPRGSCEAEARADAAALAAQGMSMHVTSDQVVSFADGKATILVQVAVGPRVVVEHVYTQHHGGRWWMTGGDDSGGDLGF